MGGGCTPDSNVPAADEELAAIAVDPISFALDLEGGEQTVSVTSNGAWAATCLESDVVVTPATGSGNGTVTVTVPASAARNFVVTFTASKQTLVAGTDMVTTTTASAEVAVSQNAGGVNMDDFLFYEKCGDDVEKIGSNWPYVDQFTGWSKEGNAAANVVYSGKNASVRASGTNYQPTEDAVGVTGQPYLFLNKVPADAYFVIEDLAVTGGSNYIFTYNVSCQNGYSGTPTFATVDNSLVHLELGYDGETWDAVDCEFVANGGNGWYAATAEFKVAADATKLYARFTYEAPAKNGGGRFDDFKLVAGGDGAELAPEADPVTEATIAEIEVAGKYIVKNAWAVATYAYGCLLTDATGKYILAYNPTETPAVGEVVNIEGAVSAYAGFLQFGAGGVVTKTGETKTVTNPTAEVLDGAALDAWLTAPVIKYVEYTGTLAISSGKYYNVTVEGAATAQGAVQYPDDTLKAQLTELDGKNIKVTGYLIGISSSKYANTMATSVEEVTAVEPEPTPTAKTLPYAETFNASQGDFTFNNVLLPEGSTYVWKWDSYNNAGYMKASAFIGSAKASESWLVSPEVSLAGATAPELKFSHTHKFAGTASNELTLWVKESSAADWTQVVIPNYGTNNDYNYVDNALDLSAYAGKTIQVAFKYVSSTSAAATWQVKDFSIAEKSAAVEPEQPIVNGKEVTVQTNGGDGTNKDSWTFTTDPVTIVVATGNHTTMPRCDADYVRVYGTADKHNTYTVSSAKKIYKIVADCPSESYAKAMAESAITTAGNVAVNATYSGATATITIADGAESIELQPSAQFRTKSVVVTYVE